MPERIYENALVAELRRSGVSVQQQALVRVWYEDIPVGDCVMDLIVEGEVVVEHVLHTFSASIGGRCCGVYRRSRKSLLVQAKRRWTPKSADERRSSEWTGVVS